MSYIPNRLVNANLITGNNELVEENNLVPYEGAYHQLYNGSAYTGPNQYSPNRRRLIPNPNNASNNTQPTGNLSPGVINEEYNATNPPNLSLLRFGLDPESFFPQPTGEDYKRGRIIRYFAKKANQTPLVIREISSEAFNDLNQQGGKYNYATWRVTSLFWKITGPIRDSRDRSGIIQKGIFDTNERLVENANKEFKGLKPYLKDKIQFAIRPNLELISDRYTGGNDLTIKQNNNPYVGYYHIMADGTIMSGQTHQQEEDIILLPANILVTNQINTLIIEALGRLGAQNNLVSQNNNRILKTQISSNTSNESTVRNSSGGSSY